MRKDMSLYGLRPVSEAPVQTYFCRDLQIGDILEWILRQTGQSHVTVSTFSTSEEFLRRFVRLREDGLVGSSMLLADRRALSKTRHLILMMAKAFDRVMLGANHSKVILVENDHIRVAVTTSQNQTRGDRFEAGMVTTDHCAIDAVKKGFSALEALSMTLDDDGTGNT